MAKTYSEKLRDPQWQKKRLLILQRDDWKCRMCGDADSTLAVHHRYYKRGAEPWDYSDNALVTLCEACHEGESLDLKDAQETLMRALSHAGLYSAEIFNLALTFAESNHTFTQDQFDAFLVDLKKILTAASGKT